jgi:hypothetical protein
MLRIAFKDMGDKRLQAKNREFKELIRKLTRK